MPAADEPTYRLSEIVRTSNESIHQAVRNGIRRASRTIRNLDCFEVTQIRGTVIDGEVASSKCDEGRVQSRGVISSTLFEGGRVRIRVVDSSLPM